MNTRCCDAGCTARVAGTESEISLPGAGEGAAGQLSIDEDDPRHDGMPAVVLDSMSPSYASYAGKSMFLGHFAKDLLECRGYSSPNMAEGNKDAVFLRDLARAQHHDFQPRPPLPCTCSRHSPHLLVVPEIYRKQLHCLLKISENLYSGRLHTKCYLHLHSEYPYRCRRRAG